MKQNWAERLSERMHGCAESLGNLLVEGFHYLALFAIGGTVFWSAAVAFGEMVGKGHASIDDILLLFIYLELGAMVGIYFKNNPPASNIFVPAQNQSKPFYFQYLSA